MVALGCGMWVRVYGGGGVGLEGAAAAARLAAAASAPRDIAAAVVEGDGERCGGSDTNGGECVDSVWGLGLVVE